jgi:hypothetical protein
MSYVLKGNDLLAAAIEWYRSNGFIPLPLEGLIPGSQINAALLHEDNEYDLFSDNNDGVSQVRGHVFPALAAISLGLDTISLAQICTEHKISLDDIRAMSFDSESSSPIILFNRDGVNASATTIHIEMYKAWASEPELRRELYRSTSWNPSSREALGLMHTNLINLWPSSRIKEHTDLLMTPKEKVSSNEFVSFEFIVSRPERLSEFPNGNPIDFIRRAGMLTEAMLRKQIGMYSSWEDFLYTAKSGQGMPLEILKAMTRVTDKTTIGLIVRGFLSVSADAFEDVLDADAIYPILQSTFSGHKDFSPILDSTIFKLNLIPLDAYPDELDTWHGDSGVFDCIAINQQTLISRVARELLNRPAEHLGHADYIVFQKLAMMNLPPQVIDFDPVLLVNHILDSISSYRTTNEIDCPTKLEMDEQALHTLEVMAKLLMRDHKFDYSKFNDRDEASKVVLIKAGFGLNLKTISRKARGDFLEDQLGL